MNTNKSNTLLRTIAIFVGILVFLLGGAGITKVAADAAIPGDALYPVKTTFEQARLSLAQDAGERAQMKIAFAAQHLKEIEALVAEGRYREIRQTVVAFETDINDALLELETVSKVDPTRASAIAAEVASALTRYAKILSDLSANAPEAVRGEFHRALDTTQLVNGLNQANSNDNANSNDDANTNGNANSNDNDSNTNGNANSNDNDSNTNGNANSNDNDSNTNGNANSNDDDSANANSNDDDGNSNANTNDDDRGTNTNTNDDDNGQDDRGGSDNSGSDDHGGDNSGKGSDDSGSDDHGGDNSGRGSDDSGQDDRGGDSSGSDDGGQEDRGGSDDSGSDD